METRELPTIANVTELANLAGVSASTVSRALAGNKMISADTRKRIEDLAEAHRFRPNQLARNLRMGSSRAIGVVLPMGHETGQHLTDPFFITLIGELADALTGRGHDLLLSRVIPHDDRWLDRLVASRRVDGAIVVGQSNQLEALDRVAERYLPLVVWGDPVVGKRHCVIGSDNFEGGRIAALRLIAGGRTRLAFFGHPQTPEIGERWRGVQEVCADVQLRPPELLPVHLTANEAYDMVALRIASGREMPDGVIAASDVVAMGALRAVAEAGLRVPQDIGIIGYDDVAIAAHTTPPLTTVRQDVARGSELLVEHLFSRIAGERTGSVTLAPKLIVRASD